MAEPLFKKIDYTLSMLLDQIEIGMLALPDIQRPFVWGDSKVRELFDSIYRGYPVGFFLFWDNGFTDQHRAIGVGDKPKIPNMLIVDGQQRLTSLYAVMKGVPVVRKNYDVERIRIAFNPLTEKFAVWDAAIEKNPEYIGNISAIWSPGTTIFTFADEYLSNLSKARLATGKEISASERARIQSSIGQLEAIKNFPFATLALSASIDEEKVAEIFVRINSEGTTLDQADFILTLMSVFWEDGRRDIEEFCRKAKSPSKGEPSPFNYFLEPTPQHLLRASVGFGFRRARLRYAYMLLRGKDLETGEFSVERRDAQFEILRDAQEQALGIQRWHDFLKSIQMAGFRGGGMVSSKITLIYAYVMFLLGRRSFGLDSFTLSNLTARWFFMTALTRRYTGGSPETAMERDLADLREVQTAGEFVDYVERTIESVFTADYWLTTLPYRLETSSGSTPVLHAYHAALNILDAKVLFSSKKVADLLDPAMRANRSAVERHHLFPKAFLATKGILAVRDTNQVANFALVEWDDNTHISDSPPAMYLPAYLEKLSPRAIERMYYWHALPSGWEEMPYPQFLQERRRKIATVIRDAYQRLLPTGETDDESFQMSVSSLADDLEGGQVEFKSTLRVNLHTSQKDPKIEHAVLKTVAGFLNTDGGTLLVGVNDSGDPLGLEYDGFPDEDKLGLHFVNLVRDRIGAKHMLHVKQSFETLKGKRVFVVRCTRALTPVWVTEGGEEFFYIRTGASTTRLPPSQIPDYIKQRFGV